MSQSSLLTQLKLQRKLQKSQSQLQISESLDSLGEEEEEQGEDSDDEINLHEGVAGEELAENIARLVLLHFFYLHFKQERNQSWGYFNARRSRLVSRIFGVLPSKETFPLFPTLNLVSAYPLAVVCECGEKVGEGNFGVVQSCFQCYGMGKPATFWPSDLKTDIGLTWIPRAWDTWAKSVAIQLETMRKSNRNSVTDLEK